MAKDKDRTQVSWKLDKLTENECAKINQWLNAQSNIQKSLAETVLHNIDRFGFTDITSHDVQRILYMDSSFKEGSFQNAFETPVMTLPTETKTKEPVVNQNASEPPLEALKPEVQEETPGESVAIPKENKKPLQSSAISSKATVQKEEKATDKPEETNEDMSDWLSSADPNALSYNHE